MVPWLASLPAFGVGAIILDGLGRAPASGAFSGCRVGGGLDRRREKLQPVERAFQDEERDRRTTERRARAAEQRVADLTRTLRLVANTLSSGGETVASRAAPTAPLMLDWTLEYDGSAHS